VAWRSVICLDTNYLILGLVSDSPETEELIGWSRSGETFCTPSTTWYEFLCGPVNATQVSTMKGVLQRILPFDDRQAQEAARLYNATGRKRRLRVDAMIAAAATTHRNPLATSNQDDFAEFVPLGLTLAQS
jgi:predicted nucleic acid-binding protein